MVTIAAIQSYEPFTYTLTKKVTGTSATSNFQLTRVAWADPFNLTYHLKEVHIVNPDGAACQVTFWDQDLSNTTPTTRGSASTDGSLYIAGVPASGSSGTGTTTVITLAHPVRFDAGIAYQVSKINTTVIGIIDAK